MPTDNSTTTTLANEVNPDSPKVVISFKTAPINKIRLSQEAAQRGLTLSEFVESIVGSFARSAENTQTLDDVTARLALYESNELLELFEQVKGQSIEFKTTSGRQVKVKVEDPTDLASVIVNSFQIRKK